MHRLIVVFFLTFVSYLLPCFGDELRSSGADERLYWDSSTGTPRLISRAFSTPEGEVLFCITYVYDDHGRIIKESLYGDPTGKNVTPLQLQSNGLPVEEGGQNLSIWYCYSQTQTGLVNPARRVSQMSVTDASGCTTLTMLNALELPENIVKKNRLGQVLLQQEMQYDSIGNKVQETHIVSRLDGSPHPFIISYKYGPGNRIEEVVEGAGSPFERRTSYLYNARGQLVQIIKPDGVHLSYQYDDAGRLTLSTASDNSIGYRYSYNAGTHVIQIEDIVHHTFMQRSYSAVNQMLSETLDNGLVLTNSFDKQGNRYLLTLPDGSSIQYCYDATHLKEVKRLSSSQSVVYSHSYTDYNVQGKLTAAQLIGNLGAIGINYDAEQRFTGLHSSYWSEIVPEEGYDKWHNLEKISVVDGVGTVDMHYGYDDSQRIVNEVGAACNSYSYDSIGNRLSKNQVPYLIDGLNQLTAVGNVHYVYDANGCLIEKRTDNQTIQYKYDALNRLIDVFEAEKISVKYTYDALGRCMTKTTSAWDKSKQGWGEEQTVRFLYDGNNEIGIVDAEGKICALRILGIGEGAEIGAAVAIELNQKVYAPIHDHSGSVRCLVDMETRSAAEYYRYSAFGETSYFDGSGHCLPNSVLGNPWGFSSKRFDEELELYCFGKRFYDPSIGRWIMPDPLGFIDGPNRYSFVHNNPIALKDPYGLFSWDSLTASLSQMFDSFHSATQQVVAFLQENLSYSRYIRPHINQMALKVCGKTFLSMLGFFDDQPEVGTYGKGELSDKVRITAINGILNLRNDIMETIRDLSDTHGGVNIHYVFYPTQGWGQDLLKATAIKFGHVSFQAQQLADTWKKLIEEMGGTECGGLIIHYAHSIGGTNTFHAKSLLTPEEQRMIRVITVGSPTMIPDEGFESVRNYVSCRDGVTLFDPVGLINGLSAETSNVIYLGTIFDVPIIDHLLTSSTYKRLIEVLGQEFLSWHKKQE